MIAVFLPQVVIRFLPVRHHFQRREELQLTELANSQNRRLSARPENRKSVFVCQRRPQMREVFHRLTLFNLFPQEHARPVKLRSLSIYLMSACLISRAVGIFTSVM